MLRNCAVNGSDYRGPSEYSWLHLEQGKLKVKCANKALSSVQTKFILLIGVWRKYHDLDAAE